MSNRVYARGRLRAPCAVRVVRQEWPGTRGNLLDVRSESAGQSWDRSRRVAGQRHGGAVSRATSQHAVRNAPEASGARMACLDT
jgi:hypothetical protein